MLATSSHPGKRTLKEGMRRKVVRFAVVDLNLNFGVAFFSLGTSGSRSGRYVCTSEVYFYILTRVKTIRISLYLVIIVTQLQSYARPFPVLHISQMTLPEGILLNLIYKKARV